MEWIVLIIFIGVIVFAFKYWYITLAIGVLGLLIYWMYKAEMRNNKRREEEGARRAMEEARQIRHKQEQEAYKNKLVVLCDSSITLFENMPEHLRAAEEYLNQAEFEFSEGAFAPFWDAIEKTANTLGRFSEGIQNIENNSSNFTNILLKYEGEPPKFPISRNSVEKLVVGTSTAERMKEIVRTAQRNFQFATIYEQRKTNQILVAGFTNLAQALEQMTWQITESINDLVGSVGSMATTLNESMSAIHSKLGDISEVNIKHNSEVIKLELDRAAREKKVLNMLDNIQHHRKPTLL